MGLPLLKQWVISIDMKFILSLSFLLAALEVSNAGPFFKAGFIKGALKGLLKGQSQGKSEDRQCQVKWEEVWKPHCTTTHETLCRNEPKQECSTEYREECWTEQRQQCTSVPEEKCWTVDNQVCWEEPREHCTEQKMKVAKKWCLEEEDDSKKKLPFSLPFP